MIFEEGDDPVIQACRNRLPEPSRVDYNTVCTHYIDKPITWEKDEIGLYIPSPLDKWNTVIKFHKVRCKGHGITFLAWVCEQDNKIYY